MDPQHLSDGGVVELRQYTLHRGRRDALIELFEREFVETQEALGMQVIGQFRDLDDADRFVWLRGFADMAARRRGLAAFYGGPVWAAHRAAANATMIDSDNVLLLRPAWPGAADSLLAGQRAALGTTEAPPGRVEAAVFRLREPAGAELLACCRERGSAILSAAGALCQAWVVTESQANDFPRLPVREGEPVLVALALFAGPGAGRSSALEAIFSPWLAKTPELLRLAPTARSALHA
jgi:hypothetical protein